MVFSSSSPFTEGINSLLSSIYIALVLVIVFLSAFGNVIVLTTLYTQNSNLRNRMDFFIANLAVCDIITCFSATFTLNNAKLHWNGRVGTCKTCYFLIFMTYAVAILTLCFAVVDRFFGICRPSKHRQVFLLNNQRLVLVSVWLISALLFAAYIHAYDVKEFKLSDGKTKQLCTQTWTTIALQAYFVAVVFMTLFLAPIVLFAFVFTKVLQKLRQPRSTTSGGNALLCERRKRMTLMLLVMVVFHYICWSPAIFTNLLHIFSVSGSSRGFLNIWLICELVHFTRSIIYPFIYYLMYKNFRASLKALFDSCFNTRSQSTTISATKEPQTSSIPASSTASDRSVSYMPEDEPYTDM